MAYLTAQNIAALQLDAAGQNTTDAWQGAFEVLSDNNSELANDLLAFEAAVYSALGEKGYNEIVQSAQKFKEFSKIEEIEHDALKNFGFTQKGISRIRLMDAISRVENGKPVYVLYSNNTKKLAKTRSDLLGQGVMYGMPSKEMNKAMDEVEMER